MTEGSLTQPVNTNLTQHLYFYYLLREKTLMTTFAMRTQKDEMLMKTFCFLFRIAESFDGRDKPSVLVTSPGSPDFNFQQKLQPPAHSKRPIGRYQGRFSQSSSIDPNIGGRMQIKLGFESSALQLIVTIVCAADITYRPNGAARNPYAKVSARTPRAPFK